MVTPKKYKDYESAMARLEQITEQLESGEAKLEEAIKLYTEGLEIARFCNDKLNEADAKTLVRNVASSDQERALVDKIKQMERFRALYFCEGRKKPSPVSLLP